jgi:hypothetical protein
MKTDNELISEFMGMERDYIEDDYGIDCDWTNPPKGQRWPSDSPPPFDISWDWLMPVVEKIGNITIPTGLVAEPWPTYVCYSISKYTTSFCIGDNSLFITDIGTGTDSELVGRGELLDLDSTPLQRTYKAVVEFIKWYNQQNHGNRTSIRDL